jgi:hypothetical protein
MSEAERSAGTYQVGGLGKTVWVLHPRPLYVGVSESERYVAPRHVVPQVLHALAPVLFYLALCWTCPRPVTFNDKHPMRRAVKRANDFVSQNRDGWIVAKRQNAP